mmetsp:Transcript_11446/g.31225  ORF Transcript_11446/g.31225 Transcript_11446/m.31225 type:complete len:214 (-) Transcript_11446:81-722(-)
MLLQLLQLLLQPPVLLTCWSPWQRYSLQLCSMHLQLRNALFGSSQLTVLGLKLSFNALAPADSGREPRLQVIVGAPSSAAVWSGRGAVTDAIMPLCSCRWWCLDRCPCLLQLLLAPTRLCSCCWHSCATFCMVDPSRQLHNVLLCGCQLVVPGLELRLDALAFADGCSQARLHLFHGATARMRRCSRGSRCCRRRCRAWGGRGTAAAATDAAV